MFRFESSGSFDKTEAFLKGAIENKAIKMLDQYGREGVALLKSATPADTGETANSWTYEIVQDKDSYSIIWNNTNIVNGQNIAVLIQHGHGTKNGGYVVGRDYINPALQPLFDKLADRVWEAVIR